MKRAKLFILGLICAYGATNLWAQDDTQDEVLIEYRSFDDTYSLNDTITEIPVGIGSEITIDLDHFFAVLKTSDPSPIATFKFRPAIVAGTDSEGNAFYEGSGTSPTSVKRGEEQSISFDLDLKNARFIVQNFWQDVYSGYYEDTIAHYNPFIDGSHKVFGFGKYQLPETNVEPIISTPSTYRIYTGETGIGHGQGTLAYAYRFGASALFINLTDNSDIVSRRLDVFSQNYTFATLREADGLDRLSPLTQAAVYDLSVWNSGFLNAPLYTVESKKRNIGENENFVSFDSVDIFFENNYIGEAATQITLEYFSIEDSTDEETDEETETPAIVDASFDPSSHDITATADAYTTSYYDLVIKINDTTSFARRIYFYAVHPLIYQIINEWNYTTTDLYGLYDEGIYSLAELGTLEFSDPTSNWAFHDYLGWINLSPVEINGEIQKDQFNFYNQELDKYFYLHLENYPNMTDLSNGHSVKFLEDSTSSDFNVQEYYDYTTESYLNYHDIAMKYLVQYQFDHEQTGYYTHSNFGQIYIKPNEFNNWAMHAEHGWIRFAENGAVGGEHFWMWDIGLDSWVYVNLNTYPWLWVQSLNAWCFYYEGSGSNGEGRWFYNTATALDVQL